MGEAGGWIANSKIADRKNFEISYLKGEGKADFTMADAGLRA
jgi:hypothetical protein